MAVTETCVYFVLSIVYGYSVRYEWVYAAVSANVYGGQFKFLTFWNAVILIFKWAR